MDIKITEYNALQTPENQEICRLLMDEIEGSLADADSKMWHGSPVWFMAGNPVVGYGKLKGCIQLLFWSGRSFEEKGLTSVGKHMAAEVRYTDVNQILLEDLHRWLAKSRDIQWDYKNIVKRQGVLERLK